MRAFFFERIIATGRKETTVLQEERAVTTERMLSCPKKKKKKHPHLDFCKERLYWKRLFREKGSITMLRVCGRGDYCYRGILTTPTVCNCLQDQLGFSLTGGGEQRLERTNWLYEWRWRWQ